MKQKLQMLSQTKNPKNLKRHLFQNEKDLYNWIVLETEFLNKYINLLFVERIYCILNGLTDRPNCLECSNKVKFHGGTYRLYCTRKCKDTSLVEKEKIRKTKQNWSEEYRNILKEEKKETCQKRFGGPAPACSPEVQRKMQDTYEERTGFRNPQQNPAVKEKIKATNLEKYGMEWNGIFSLIILTSKDNWDF